MIYAIVIYLSVAILLQVSLGEKIIDWALNRSDDSEKYIIDANKNVAVFILSITWPIFVCTLAIWFIPALIMSIIETIREMKNNNGEED